MICILLLATAVLLVSFASTISAISTPLLPAVKVLESDRYITLSNGYLSASFDKIDGSLTNLQGDFLGTSSYGANALSKPYTLEVALSNVTAAEKLLCNKSSSKQQVKYEVASSSSEDKIIVSLKGISDCPSKPTVVESWEVSLSRGSRQLSLSIAGEVVKAATVKSISHGLYSAAASQYALFDKGVVQMMNDRGRCFASNETLPRAYWIAGNGKGLSLDVQRDVNTPKNVVLMSQDTSFESALIDFVVGDLKIISTPQANKWTSGCTDDSNLTPVDVSAGLAWSFQVSLGANNMDFPALAVPDAAQQSTLQSSTDLATYLTGIYPNSPGCLQSFANDGSVAPTISTPLVGYAPSTNFFDPDNFITMTALMLSGDSYLIDQVKRVIERTASTMCGVGDAYLKSYCDAPSTRRMTRQRKMLELPNKGFVFSNPRMGQLMHHFNSMVPTYESLAGSEQLGPNVFWTLTVLKYAGVTGNIAWLSSMFPYLDASARFIASFFDDDMGLLHCPGPLWIDVIVRENYTSDSNSIAPYIFNLLADTYDLLGKDADFAAHMRDLATTIATQVEAQLWATGSDDHYITQLNPDGTTRDFVDYDSALIAVAFGVTPDDRVSKVIKRVDAGNYTHVRATYPCEIPYSGDANDCYIVGGTVCGDSIVTMGRIGWVDALARKRIGDKNTFDNLLLQPLQDDLLKYTWLYERYDQNGMQTRTPYYFEYPSLVTMLLAEVRYGITLLPNKVIIDPFMSADSYHLKFGIIDISYSQTNVVVSLPGDGSTIRTLEIRGLIPNKEYEMPKYSDTCQAGSTVTTSDANGFISMAVTFSQACPIFISSAVTSA